MKFNVYKDASKQFRWRLKANNHQIIATSAEAYKNRADAVVAIALIIDMNEGVQIEFGPDSPTAAAEEHDGRGPG